MSTTTDLSTLKINYLTQAQYDEAVEDGLINENELYFTPDEGQTAYVSKLESSYTTTSSSTTTVPIGITNFGNYDMLFVDVNGLDLIQNTDYTISGQNIVLTTPITTVGTVVHFTVIRMISIASADYSQLKGDSAGFGTVSATVDNNTGTPSVTATATGPDTAKNISFEFHNLKGRDGVDGVDGTHTISYTPIVTGGAQIGTITIDSTDYPVYAPGVVWG